MRTWALINADLSSDIVLVESITATRQLEKPVGLLLEAACFNASHIAPIDKRHVASRAVAVSGG